jgi:ABC-type sugar transport system permease subunit
MKKKKPKIDRGDLIFYCIFMAWPVLQFLVYYVGVNINSILMSFQFNTIVGEEIVTDYFSLEQYKRVFEWFGNADFKNYLSVSLRSYLITTCIGLPLGLLFAFYIYKKLPFWGGFRVILFLPSILSGVVVARIFSDFLSAGAPAIFGNDSALGTLLDPTKENYFPVLMFYNVWIGFGTAVLMYSNKMSAIPEEIIESAQLDGVTPFKELILIVLPSIWNTFVTFMVSAVVGIFTNQMALVTFYGMDAEASLYTFGYYLYRGAKVGTNVDYPYLSAMGLLLTVIAVPITLFTRWSLKKFGPSKE